MNINNGKTNWVNLLEAGSDIPLWNSMTATISILANQNTRIGNNKSWSIADDMQSFSNIQTDKQIPIAPAIIGITDEISTLKMFLGVRNMNSDYFASPLTGLFTNSSHGIYPTIADNFNVGNYPVTSLCFHAEWNITKEITLKNSLYNGEASYKWDEAFRFRPSRDGIINITEIAYSSTDSSSYSGEYHLGGVYGSKNSNYSIFALVEQPIIIGVKPISLLFQGGFAPKKKNDTYYYMGTGIVMRNILKRDDAIGISANRSLYTEGKNENCMELTYSIPINNHIEIQPSAHFIHSNGDNYTVALLRATFSL